MESSSGSRCGEISSDLFIILVTGTQLIFFAFFHEYIAWFATEPDGSVTRLSLLTDAYFTWLPIVVVGSILVIVASLVLIIYDRTWFRRTATIGFNVIGIVVTVSLVLIFPFDFSVIPNATAAHLAPTAVRVFFLLLATFYGVTALVMLVKWRNSEGTNENSRGTAA